MKNFFSRVKKKLAGEDDFDLSETGEDYVELDTINQEDSIKSKVIVRPFTINDFSDIKLILDALREGNTIALVNIRPLKDKDLVELKRAVNKLKKTCDAIDGDIAGFGEDYVVITPALAKVYRQASAAASAAGSVARPAVPKVDLKSDMKDFE